MNKLFKKAVASVMALTMIFGLVSVNTYAAATDKTFKVICIGDSTSNGYMLEDFGTAVNGTADDPNGVGFLNNGSKSAYPYLLQSYFNSNLPTGYTSAEVLNLTMAGMRTDELRAILDENYKNSDLADYFCDDHMDGFSTQFRSDYAANFAGDEYWQNIVAGNSEGSYSTMNAYYTQKVTDADLIVLDTTMNNFGTYLCSRLQAILGMNGFELADYSDKAANVIAAATDLTETELAVINQGVAQIDSIVKAQFASMGEEKATQFADMFEYCYADFCVNYSYNLKKIAELNPDAMLVIVNSYNGMNGLTIASNETTVDFGAFWGQFMSNVDKYITDYANYNNLDHTHADLSSGLTIFMDELASGNVSINYKKKIVATVYDDFGADTVSSLLYNGVTSTITNNYSNYDTGISLIGTINVADYLLPYLSQDDFTADKIKEAYASGVDTSNLMSYAQTIVYHDGFNSVLKLMGKAVSTADYNAAVTSFKICCRLMAFDQILNTLVKAANYTTVDISKLFAALGDSGYMNLVAGVISGSIAEGSDDYDIAMAVLHIYDRFLACKGIGTHPNAQGCQEKYEAVEKATKEIMDLYETNRVHQHTVAVDVGKAATCTESGLTEGSHCSVCGEVIKAQEVIPALGHDYQAVVTKAATCEEAGTATYICSRCNDSYDGVIPAKGHTVVVDEGKAATCTESGLTEGSHCSVCNKVIQAQEVIPALGHTEVIDAAVPATCSSTGLTEGSHCLVCGEVIKAQEKIPMLAHTEVTDAAVAATCTETGLTEGSHCSVCNTVIQAQEVIPALGHDYKETVVEPTETEQGYTLHECTRCGDSYKDNYTDPVISKLPYTDVPEGKWYYSWVKEAYQLKLMTGKNETTFAPYDDLTRGQLAVILYRMAGEPDVEYKDIFPDVPEGKYYSDAVMWAYENKIVTGYLNDNTFRPSKSISRQELALMLMRYAEYCGKKGEVDMSVLADYPDASSISSWAKEGMAWAVSNHLISGDQGNLNPTGTANRAQAAKMVVQAYKTINQ